MLKFVPVILFLFNFVVTRQFEDDILEKVYNALDNVLDFIYTNKDEFNLDGLFGVVFVKSQLESIAQSNLSARDLQKIQESVKTSSKILTESKILKRNLNSHYKIFAKYLFSPSIWSKSVNFTRGALDVRIFVPKVDTCEEYEAYVTATSLFNESLSDFCISELINSSLGAKQSCEISEFCLHYMVENTNHAFGYEVTHRLLYLQIATARRCKWNKTWLNTKIQNYCSYIYWEAQNNAKCDFLTILDDLFLEQILLCGYEGFSEFFQPSWINYVLSIQCDNGCFTAFKEEDGEKIERSELRRRKREYNVLDQGCVDHTTGLGAGVLGLFVKFLLKIK